MNESILTLPFDRSKRHLVVGDIHGKWKQFKRALAAANYNKHTDILYSVGDMIDRGRNSYKIVEWFHTHDNVYSVKGNHEYLMLQAMTSSKLYDLWVSNGGDATLKSILTKGIAFEKVVGMLDLLPLCIEVGEPTESDSFRILHADFPGIWSDAQLHKMLDESHPNFQARAKMFLWGRTTVRRSLAQEPNEYNAERYRTTFLGHTKITKPIFDGDLVFIDTGASNTLTIIDAITKETYTS